MKKIAIMLLVAIMLVACLSGCGAVQSTETTADPYERENTQDYFRCVYSEQYIYLWVNTLDNSVWVQYSKASFVPYTIDGQTVYWQGSLEATFNTNTP